MKVLLVARSFSRGGAATGAANLALALEAAGLEVVRASGEGRPGRARRMAERIVERLLFDAETHCVRIGRPAIDLAAEVDRHRPDVVQFCDISANTVSAEEVSRLPCPCVHRMSDFWPYHGPRHYAERPGDAPALARALFRHAGQGRLAPAARVAPSDWLADRVAAAGGARPRVIANAVPPAPEARPRRLDGAAPLRLGFVSGKLSDPRKGLAHLAAPLQAAASGRRLELVTFGRPPAPGGLEGLIVRHRGPFARDEIARVMGEIDILLCPSRADNSPNTVTEALAHGVPVIGQVGTGIASYVDEDRGALLDFWGATPPRLDTALDRIVARYPEASAAALAFARGPLAPETVGRAYAALYAELLAP